MFRNGWLFLLRLLSDHLPVISKTSNPPPYYKIFLRVYLECLMLRGGGGARYWGKVVRDKCF